MGLKTFIRNWLKVERCDNYLNNYKKCLCNKTVIFKAKSSVESYNGKDSVIINDKTTILGSILTASFGGKVIIGHDCHIGENSKIWSACKIEIGNYVKIAHNTTIIDNNSHPINPYKRRNECLEKDLLNLLSPKPIKICDDAWIGANCVILKGVTIGEAAIVGAGSVVTHDVEPWTIVAGNPAKVIKRIEHKL